MENSEKIVRNIETADVVIKQYIRRVINIADTEETWLRLASLFLPAELKPSNSVRAPS